MTTPTRRTRWVQNSPHTLSLEAGDAVLAVIVQEGSLRYSWLLADASAGGVKETEYAAMRAARKATNNAANSERS